MRRRPCRGAQERDGPVLPPVLLRRWQARLAYARFSPSEAKTVHPPRHGARTSPPASPRRPPGPPQSEGTRMICQTGVRGEGKRHGDQEEIPIHYLTTKSTTHFLIVRYVRVGSYETSHALLPSYIIAHDGRGVSYVCNTPPNVTWYCKAWRQIPGWMTGRTRRGGCCCSAAADELVESRAWRSQ